MEWKAKVAYNSTAQKFAVAWRETPGTDPSDATVNHIRVNTWGGGVCPPEANIVVSSTTGTEDPALPFIASSTTSSKTLVGWQVHRYLLGRIFGTLLDIPGQKKKANNDFNGDGKSDVEVDETATGFWNFHYSGDNSYGFDAIGVGGGSQWKRVPGDYDGGKKAYVVVYDTTNGWWLFHFSSGAKSANGAYKRKIPGMKKAKRFNQWGSSVRYKRGYI